MIDKLTINYINMKSIIVTSDGNNYIAITNLPPHEILNVGKYHIYQIIDDEKIKLRGKLKKYKDTIHIKRDYNDLFIAYLMNKKVVHVITLETRFIELSAKMLEFMKNKTKNNEIC